MAEHKDCKHYDDCDYRNDIGCCPNWCAQFKHKDDVRVIRCKDCFANGCCSVQIDLDMGDEGYCSKGRKDNDNRTQL